jgi:hypothetical protein
MKKKIELKVRVDREHPIVSMNEPLIPHNSAFFKKHKYRNKKGDCAGFEGGFRLRFRPAVNTRSNDGEG